MAKISQCNMLPDGSVIDLNSYEWPNDIRLNKREKLFIVWYCLPNSEAYLNPTKAALKAGYPLNSAYRAKWNLVRKPKIKNLIDKFSDQFIKIAIKDAAKKLMDEKIRRATYNINDFYEEKEIYNDNNQPRVITSIKPIEALTDEQRRLVDNVEFTNTGIPTYKLPNKEKEINDIIKLNTELNQEKSTGDYDVETTVGVIKDNLTTVKTTIHLSNQKIKENAQNYIESTDNQPEFD